MKKILIKNYIDKNMAVSYDDGKRCQKDIIEFLKINENVMLDFAGVDYVIIAFLNPIIGDLILQYGNDVMKKIIIRNANEMTIQKIKMMRDGVLIKREDMDE